MEKDAYLCCVDIEIRVLQWKKSPRQTLSGMHIIHAYRATLIRPESLAYDRVNFYMWAI